MINHLLYRTVFKAAILTGCFFMQACENDVNQVKELGIRKPGIEVGKGIESYLSENGRMNARLTAPVLLRYQGDSARKAEFPNSLHVDFFNDSLKVESQLFAKYGRYLENENKVFLKDSVVVFNVKGDSLFCEELYWDQALNKFHTNKKVTISQKFRSTLLIGLDGMDCNSDLSDLHLYRMQSGSFFTIPDSTANPVPVHDTVPAPPHAAIPPAKTK